MIRVDTVVLRVNIGPHDPQPSSVSPGPHGNGGSARRPLQSPNVIEPERVRVTAVADKTGLLLADDSVMLWYHLRARQQRGWR